MKKYIKKKKENKIGETNHKMLINDRGKVYYYPILLHIFQVFFIKYFKQERESDTITSLPIEL